MKDLASSYLTKPPVSWNRAIGQDMKVKDWIVPGWETSEEPHVVLMGAPLSRSSISASAASEFPAAFRQSWSYYSTYYIDDQIDFRELKVADLGDIQMHGTNILTCHSNIQNAMTDVLKTYPNSFTITIGGDHSITAPLIRAYPAESKKRIGIIQFDTHLDLRNVEEHGPSNGTPIRQLLDGGIVRGEDVYNIGLHGFYNAPSLIEAANHYGVNMITLKEFRRKGAAAQIKEVVEKLKEKVDLIYVTIDIDVLDIAYAPGVPASTPGGMRTDELFDLLYELGKYDGLTAMDFVCIDPYKDTNVGTTVKAVTYAFLTYLVSRYKHLHV